MADLVGVITGYMIFFWGIFILVKYRVVSNLIEELLEFKALFYTVCMMLVLAGLVIVSVHNRWAWSRELLLTVIGWSMVIEGSAYCFLPFPVIRRWMRKFYYPYFWLVSGVIAVILGLFLVGIFV